MGGLNAVGAGSAGETAGVGEGLPTDGGRVRSRFHGVVHPRGSMQIASSSFRQRSVSWQWQSRGERARTPCTTFYADLK